MATAVFSQHRQHRGPPHLCASQPALRGFACRAFYAVAVPPSPRVDPPRRSRSSPIPIGAARGLRLAFADDPAELWAGPAYSNSPPPSSLPIPNFSLCRRISSSAPASPARLPSPAPAFRSASAPSSPASSVDEFSFDAVFATRDLCRILNLDAGCD